MLGFEKLSNYRRDRKEVKKLLSEENRNFW